MLLTKKVHQWIFYFALALLVIGLPLSKFLMSLSQIILICNWVTEGSIKEKYNHLKKSNLGKALIILFLLYCIGALYSTDLGQAWKEIRIKIPLLILPIVLLSREFKNQTLVKYLYLIVISTFISTFISFLIYHGFFNREVNNFRDISPFISHIRLSLMVVMSMLLLAWTFIRNRSKKEPIKYLSLMGIAWFAYFLMIIQSFTGIAIIACLVFITLTRQIVIYNKRFKWPMIIGLVTIIIALNFLAVKQYNSYFSFTPIEDLELPLMTKNGAYYHHYTERTEIENGNYVWLNISWRELRENWKTKSKMSLVGKDKKGQHLDATLIRYLASKGLNKDKEGIDKLNQEDIRAIENGVANYRFLEESGIQIRLYKVYWQIHRYLHGENPEGNSLTQRFEFWKCSFKLFKNNPIFGVGTGDLKEGLNNIYGTHTELDKKYWRKLHNQYLNLAAMFGALGLILFIGVLGTFFISAYRNQNHLLMLFLIVACISFLTEDTLDTQAGISFFAFFCCFLPHFNRSE